MNNQTGKSPIKMANLSTDQDPLVENEIIEAKYIELEISHGIEILPEEALINILLFVPDEDLKHCLIVCKTWCNIIQGPTLWRNKCLRTGRFVDEIMAPFFPSDWREFYYKAPYTRNLIKNCSGQDVLNAGWKILQNRGDQWKVEQDHAGSDHLPDEVRALSQNKSYNFATSYGWCSMEQVIDLVKEGVTEELLDSDVQPDILVSEWYAARFDCGNTYEMEVTLLTKCELSEKYTLAEFTHGPVITPQWAPRNWNKVEHKFSNYGPGLRYIRFFHKGKDTQFWAGHYGCKMAGAQVRIQFTRDMQKNRVPKSAIKKEQAAQWNKQEGDEEDIYN